jgi:hypothetical protein
MQIAHQTSKDQNEETKTIEKKEKTQELDSRRPQLLVPTKNMKP